jgi:Holliday junction resolvase RusA-like endonuclease
MGLPAPPQCTQQQHPTHCTAREKKEKKGDKKMICFFHECNPPKSTAQQRQFFSKGKTALTPAAKKAAATWQAIVEQHKPTQPLTGPLIVKIGVSWFKKGLSEVEPRITKPDVDNLAKLILDAMTKTGYWLDDNQVCDLRVTKYNSPIGGLAVTVMEANSRNAGKADGQIQATTIK